MSKQLQLTRLRAKILKALSISPQLGLGDVTGLLNSFEAALHQLRILMKEDGPDPDFFSEVLHSAGQLVDAFIKESAFDAAIKVRQDLVGISDEFASREPSDERLHLAALQTESDYGQTLCEAGQWAEALPVLQSVAKNYRRLPRGHNLARIQKQSRTLHWLGECLMYFLNWKGAAAAFDEALRLDSRLSQLYPSNARLLRDYAVSLLKRGDASVEMGRWEHAAMLFSAAATLMERRVDKSPDNFECRRDYAVALEKHGLALQQTAKPDRAADQMMKSLDQLKDLYIDSDPNDKEISSDILFVAQQLTRLYIQRKERAKAKSVISDEILQGIRTRFGKRRFLPLRHHILLLICEILDVIVVGNRSKHQPDLNALIAKLKDTKIAPEIQRQFSFRTAILEFSAVASRGVPWRRARKKVN